MVTFIGILPSITFARIIATCSLLLLTRALRAPSIRVACLLPVVVALILFQFISNFALVVSQVRVITRLPCIKGCHANGLVVTLAQGSYLLN